MDIKLCVILCTLLTYGYCQEGLQCPDGWEPVSGICYKFVKTSANFSEASSACEEQGGHLLRVKDIEKCRLLFNMMKWKDIDNSWLGITKKEDTCGNVICRQQGWLWQDGTGFEPTIEFNPWYAENLAPGYDPYARCVHMRPSSYGNTWSSTNGRNEVYFICEKAAPCDSGWDENGGRCYKFELHTFKSCPAAMAECAENGATLFTLSGDEEDNFIAITLAARNVNPPYNIFWMGLNYTGRYNCGSLGIDIDCRRRNWAWQDGTKYQYPTWHHWTTIHTEPDSPQDLCASMRRLPADGWFGTACDSALTYICEKELNGTSRHITTSTITTATTTTTNTTPTTTTATAATAKTNITTSTKLTGPARTTQTKTSLRPVTSTTPSSSPESPTSSQTPLPDQSSASSLASSPGTSSTTLATLESLASLETPSHPIAPAPSASTDNPDSMPMYMIGVYTLVGVLIIVVIVAIALQCKRRNNMEHGGPKPTDAGATSTDTSATSAGAGVTPNDAGNIDILPGQPAQPPATSNTLASQHPASQPHGTQSLVALPPAVQTPALTAPPVSQSPAASQSSASESGPPQHPGHRPSAPQPPASHHSASPPPESRLSASQPQSSRPSASVPRVSGVSYVNDTELGYERPMRQDNVYEQLQ